MLRIRRWGTLVLSVSLALALITGCASGDKEEAKAKDEAAQGDKQAEGNGGQEQDENPVPVVNVDLGMDPKEVAAEYEGGKITVEDFENYLEIQAFINPQAGLAIQQKDPQALKMLMESYISELVMASRAQDVKDADKDAKELVDRIKGQYLMVYNNDEKKLEKQMKDQGVTDKELNEFFVRYKQVEAYLQGQVSEDELKKNYEEGRKAGNFTVASVRHILISVAQEGQPATEGATARTDEEAKKLAQDISGRLKKGEDFAKLAKEFSDDPGSKENGGLYEDVDVSQWVPEFKQAAIELPLNEISDPVKTDFGYHVMKVEKRSEKSFADVKEQLKAQFINQKYDEFLEKELNQLVKKINLPEAKQQQ